MIRAVSALAALSKALGAGVSTCLHDDGTVSVTLSYDTDAAAEAAAVALDVSLARVGNEQTTWLSGRRDLGEVNIGIHGPPRFRHDDAAIAAAVAQAEEAVRS